MEFQLEYGTAHLFADAVAAFIRGRADTVWLNERGEEWDELYETFRDSDNATLKVSADAGRLMYNVWGAPWAWRDEPTRQAVKAEIRPQWYEQMSTRLPR